MPATVRAARLGLTLQFAFGCIGLAFALVAVITVGSLAGLGLLAVMAVIVAFTGRLIQRLSTRSSRPRWTALGFQLLVLLIDLGFETVDHGLTLGSLPRLGLLVPVFVIAMLLTPAAGRWFTAPATPSRGPRG